MPNSLRYCGVDANLSAMPENPVEIAEGWRSGMSDCQSVLSQVLSLCEGPLDE